MATDFVALMPEIARILLGEPNAALSSKTEWRYGQHGSLSVDLAKGVFHNHETDEKGGALALISSKTGRVNGEAFAWLREHGFAVDDAPRKQEPAQFRVVKRWDYVDESGDLIFQVERQENGQIDKDGKRLKRYLQRRRAVPGDDPSKVRDGWIYSVKGARQVPYRLPELLDDLAADRTIFIVEGEKCADALRSAGLPTTTSAMGANKWNPILDATFTGADVVLIPDNDDVGRKHADDVAGRLQSVASRVRVVELPGLPPKGDVVDWLEGGGSPDALLQLIDASAPSAPAAAETSWPLCSVSDWLERALPEPDFLMGEWLSTTSRALIIGPSGLGKTKMGLAIAASVALGRDFLHWRAKRPARVLYIDGEMSRRLMKRRVRDAMKELGVERADNLFVLSTEDVDDFQPLNSAQGQSYADRLIGHFSPDLIVFDNIQALLIGEMKEEEQWANVLPWVRAITRRSIGQVWFHHTGHDESRGYGSKAREWQMDVVALMERIEPGEADLAFQLTFTKARERTPENRADFEPVVMSLKGQAWERQTPGIVTTRSVGDLNNLHRAKEVFLTLLDNWTKQGREISPRPSANYAPSKFAEHSMAKQLGKNAKALLAEAMNALLEQEHIAIVTNGPPSHRRQGLARTVPKAA